MSKAILKIFLTCLVFISTLLFLPRVLAHAFPKQEEPRPNSIVQAPKTVTITFNEELEPEFSTLWITDSNNQKIASGGLNPDNIQIMTLNLPSLPAGIYHVYWKVISRDGHQTEGKYEFTVK